jgi:7-carboxy-7-deazaguanine synthase
LANCEPIRHVIYTGGEPTLQPFHRIQKELGPRWTAEIETNGTTIPHLLFEDFTLSDYARFQWNVSPKGEVAGGALKPDALRHWAEISKKHRKIYFKFVIRKNHAFEDLESVLITAKAHNLSRSRLLLMSEGNGRDSQVEGAWLAEICGKQNIRYTPRLHVILYGSKRGV